MRREGVCAEFVRDGQRGSENMTAITLKALIRQSRADAEQLLLSPVIH